jgi:hypothetical protein
MTCQTCGNEMVGVRRYLVADVVAWMHRERGTA